MFNIFNMFLDIIISVICDDGRHTIFWIYKINLVLIFLIILSKFLKFKQRTTLKKSVIYRLRKSFECVFLLHRGDFAIIS